MLHQLFSVKSVLPFLCLYKDFQVKILSPNLNPTLPPGFVKTYPVVFPEGNHCRNTWLKAQHLFISNDCVFPKWHWFNLINVAPSDVT